MTNLPFFFALRYIAQRKQTPFVNFIFWFSLIGMALGVMALIIVLSIMNGFQSEIKQRYSTILPDIHIKALTPKHDINKILALLSPNDSISPTLYNRGSIQYDDDTQLIEIHAIEPKKDKYVVDLYKQITLGSMKNLQQFNIILGTSTAARLGVSIGDKVKLTIPKINITPLGIFPRQRSMHVIALFESNTDKDSELAFIHLNNAKKLFKVNDTNQYRIRLDDTSTGQLKAKEWQQQLNANNWQITHWQQPMKALFSAMAMEKRLTGLMLSIIIIVAAFNIVSGLFMIVANKRADIAVLRTLGASKSIISRIFLYQGLTIGVTGTAIGALIGSLCALYLDNLMIWLQTQFGFSIFDPNVFYISAIPSIWLWQDFILTISGAIAIAIISSIYPAIKATTISPAESLQYNH